MIFGLRIQDMHLCSWATEEDFFSPINTGWEVGASKWVADPGTNTGGLAQWAVDRPYCWVELGLNCSLLEFWRAYPRRSVRGPMGWSVLQMASMSQITPPSILTLNNAMIPGGSGGQQQTEVCWGLSEN